MRRVCVYCGSSSGVLPEYSAAARELADVLVRHELELVYGGADKGIMGVLADAMLEHGGKVHGVIPKMLTDKEIAHQGLTELHVVASMHQRKTMMAALSDGFIALPGGYGTLEEIIEIITWGQLRFHDKPCGLLCAASTAICCSWIRTPPGSSSNSSAIQRHTSRSGRRSPAGQRRPCINLSFSCPFAGALRFCPCNA
jgi:uncharacterized protein (TIGR00730 family)